ncbi:MAG: EamA family transporter [archaeon]
MIMNRKTPFFAILLVVICTFLTSSGQYFMKMGTDRISGTFLSIFNIPLISGLLLYVFGAVLLIIALKHGELSVVYPFISLSFIWVLFLSVFLLGETVLLINWLGMILIVMGVVFIGRGAPNE